MQELTQEHHGIQSYSKFTSIICFKVLNKKEMGMPGVNGPVIINLLHVDYGVR
jgi:hypothetical protein